MEKRQSDPPVSQRLIDAFARGEVTEGGMAEAGWFIVGTLTDAGCENIGVSKSGHPSHEKGLTHDPDEVVAASAGEDAAAGARTDRGPLGGRAVKAAIATALAAAVLTGAAPTAHADPNTFATATAHADPGSFLAHVHALGFTGGAGGDVSLLADGYANCKALVAGVTIYDVRMIARRTLVPKGYTVSQVESYVWDAVYDLCPDVKFFV